MTMRRTLILTGLALGILLAASACTTYEGQTAIWRNWDHFKFSWKNMGAEGDKGDVTQGDISQAQQQKWWGEVIRPKDRPS